MRCLRNDARRPALARTAVDGGSRRPWQSFQLGASDVSIKAGLTTRAVAEAETVPAPPRWWGWDCRSSLPSRRQPDHRNRAGREHRCTKDRPSEGKRQGADHAGGGGGLPPPRGLGAIALALYCRHESAFYLAWELDHLKTALRCNGGPSAFASGLCRLRSHRRRSRKQTSSRAAILAVDNCSSCTCLKLASHF